MTRRTVGAVFLAGAGLLLLAVVLVASRRDYRLLGSNRVQAWAFPLRLEHGRRTVCQHAGVPAGTGAVRVLTGTFGRPRPPLVLRVDDRPATRIPAGREGWVRLPTGRVPSTIGDARLCVSAAGASPVRLGGRELGGGAAARTPAGRPLGVAARLEFVTAQRQPWWTALGPIARRFSYGKAPWAGRWTLWLIAALMLVGAGAAAWAVTRPVPRQ